MHLTSVPVQKTIVPKTLFETEVKTSLKNNEDQECKLNQFRRQSICTEFDLDVNIGEDLDY